MGRLICAVALLLAALAGPALAHTGAGSTSGFAAGLHHPMGGLDHLLAMVAVGVLAAQLGGRALWAVPAAFVGMMLVGGLAAMAGIGLPLVELGIAGSVVILGAVIALGRRLPLAGAVALAGVLAVFHGHAHGLEMPAAASGLAYAAGFALATATLHVAGLGLGLGARTLSERAGRALLAIGGAGVSAAGLALLGL